MQYIAKIKESECVGCNRCVSACPVDAIVGSLSLTHSIITDECIGCKLCLPPCPTDCIEIEPLTKTVDKEERLERALLAKKRHSSKLKRQAKTKTPLLPAFIADKEEKKVIIKDYISEIKQKMENRA